MKVVIIDDTQIALTFLRRLVEKMPECEAVCFTDAVAGLEWCLNNQPDLLVVDFMMPKLSGIDLVEQFRKAYADIPVLMITANHTIELRHLALQTGVTDFLHKPLDSVEFRARAKNMLDLRTSHKKLACRATSLADEVHKAVEKIAAQERATIFCLAKATEYRDPETGSHILRMAHYSRHIARALGLPVAQQELMFDAAPMHDIGKVGIPDAILLKPTAFTPAEFTIMKQHSRIGFEVLSQTDSPLLQTAAEVAHTHHEKFDGSGYPRGLAGTDIPLFGRIAAVADVFDALTSARPYKPAWKIDHAVDMLKENKGKHFDPACVEAFFTNWEEVLEIRIRFADHKGERATN